MTRCNGKQDTEAECCCLLLFPWLFPPSSVACMTGDRYSPCRPVLLTRSSPVLFMSHWRIRLSILISGILSSFLLVYPSSALSSLCALLLSSSQSRTSSIVCLFALLYVIVIVMTWAAKGSRHVHQLLHTGHYAAPPKTLQGGR